MGAGPVIRCGHDGADVRLSQDGQDFDVCADCHARIVRIQRAAHGYLPMRRGRGPEARMHDYRIGYMYTLSEKRALANVIWSDEMWERNRKEKSLPPRRATNSNWPYHSMLRRIN